MFSLSSAYSFQNTFNITFVWEINVNDKTFQDLFYPWSFDMIKSMHNCVVQKTYIGNAIRYF